MFDQWHVLHIDAVEADSILFCRALEQEDFGGHCESVRSFDEALGYLECALYKPRFLSRPDIIVINWRLDCDARVLEFAHWVRVQPQLHATPVIVFIKAPLSFTAQEHAQHAGVTELIVRPDSFEDLLREVRALLERCMNRCVMR